MTSTTTTTISITQLGAFRETRARSALAAELASARQHLNRRAEINAKMIAWRDDLQRRIEIEELRSEAAGDDGDRGLLLTEEAADFARAVRYYGWTGPRRAPR